MDSEQIVFVKDGALEEYASVKPGEPFRLFRYGDIYKGGRKRTVSKANPFKLPHFKPPIKLGSHKDETPAGGFLTGLEAREDGIWAIPEFNEEGAKALDQGAYRYHSPEVIWEDGAIEDPDTGKLIEGPLIVGVALTHTPHLGESTALYTYQQEQNLMGEQIETVNVPKDFFETITGFFKREPQDEPQEEPRDDFEAIKQERDDMEARLNALEAEKAQKELYASIAQEFKTEEYGEAFSAMAEDEAAVEMLAKMDEPVRAWVLERFAALSKQAEAITEEIGEDDALPENTTEAFAMAVDGYMKEHDVDYIAAVTAVAQEKPDLYKAYRGGK